MSNQSVTLTFGNSPKWPNRKVWIVKANGKETYSSTVKQTAEIEYRRAMINEVNTLCERERKEAKCLNSEQELGYESWL